MCSTQNTTENKFQSDLSDLIQSQTNAKEVDTLGGFVIVFFNSHCISRILLCEKFVTVPLVGSLLLL